VDAFIAMEKMKEDHLGEEDWDEIKPISR